MALPVTISFFELACHTNATYPVTPPSLCNYAHLGESLREIKISKSQKCEKYLGRWKGSTNVDDCEKKKPGTRCISDNIPNQVTWHGRKLDTLAFSIKHSTCKIVRGKHIH